MSESNEVDSATEAAVNAAVSAAPTTSGDRHTLTVAAPKGSHFEMEEVKTARGETSLGEVPILIWDDLQAAVDFYGAEAVLNLLDGTSLRVSFQSIARRLKAQPDKGVDDIANAQVAFRPGKRQGGASTPASRTRKAADSAASKVGAEGSDVLSQLLEKVASGELSIDALKGLVGQ